MKFRCMSKVARFAILSLLFMSVGVSTPAMANLASSGGGELASLFVQKSKFLPVHQAFGVEATQQGDVLTVSFRITPEHYIYKDKIKLTLPHGLSADTWTFDKVHTMVDDPDFGRVAVFEQDVVATAKLHATSNIDAPISIRWQGCAKAGLCYPPETVKTSVNLVANTKHTKETTEQNAQSLGVSSQTSKSQDIKDKSKTTKTTTDEQLADVSSASDTSSSPLVKVVDPQTSGADLEIASDTAHGTQVWQDLAEQETSHQLGIFGEGQDKNEVLPSKNPSPQSSQTAPAPQNNHQAVMDNSDPFGVHKNPVLAVLLLFLAGLLLSFTPCVYPMIPIVANIVTHHHKRSAMRGLALSGSYGLGVATAYGVLGAVIAWLGQAVGVLGMLQNPYVLGVFAIVFALLALCMFDVVKIGLPAGIKSRLHKQSQRADGKLGSVGGSFLAGALSALVVSPCVSAPMAGALTAVSSSSNVYFGFVALFSLGLGLSLPLMFIGLAQGKFMPKAGEWMNRVKEFCGLLLLAVSLSLLERLIISPLMLVIWAVWFAVMAFWLFKIKNIASQGFALVGAIWAVCLVVGASMGANDAWRPLANFKSQHTESVARADIKITTLDELDEVLAYHDKVLVDITADWCVECRVMERTLFTNRPAVLDDYQVVKLDISKTNDDSRAVLSRYQLFGPPALLIYKNNQLQTIMLGEVGRADFEQTLARF